MSRIDIVIFGATGFTGKYAVEEMAKLVHKYPGITWAVAGRSKKRLQDVLEIISLKIGEDLKNIPIIIADVKDYESLQQMCSQTKVVANCCGPYFEVGEPVIRAAIDCKTHYVDVAAEIHFMESMQLKYDKQARDAGVYIVSACGVDSIPNDIGVLFLGENFKGTLNSVESYLQMDVPKKYIDDMRKYGVVHKTSWDSLLSNLIHSKDMEKIRRKLFPDPLPTPKVLLKDRFIHKNNNFLSMKVVNPDESVINRTQRHLYATEQKRPVQFQYYYRFISLFRTIVTFIGFFLINIFIKIRPLRKYLYGNYKLFTFGMMTDEGPTEQAMDNSKIIIDLFGKGWSGPEEGKPNKKMTLRVSMFNAYRATVIAQNIAAITILLDIDKMPKSGGVLTPGAAFWKTDLIKRLNENGIKFEITKK